MSNTSNVDVVMVLGSTARLKVTVMAVCMTPTAFGSGVCALISSGCAVSIGVALSSLTSAGLRARR